MCPVVLPWNVMDWLIILLWSHNNGMRRWMDGTPMPVRRVCGVLGVNPGSCLVDSHEKWSPSTVVYPQQYMSGKHWDILIFIKDAKEVN